MMNVGSRRVWSTQEAKWGRTGCCEGGNSGNKEQRLISSFSVERKVQLIINRGFGTWREELVTVACDSRSGWGLRSPLEFIGLLPQKSRVRAGTDEQNAAQPPSQRTGEGPGRTWCTHTKLGFNKQNSGLETPRDANASSGCF